MSRTYTVSDHRLFQDLRPDVPLSASVAGWDGSIVATIRRHTEAPETGSDGDDRAVVAVVGDLDRETTPLLEPLLRQAIERRAEVFCDLSEVTFFAAAGVSLLVAAHRQAVAAGHRFAVRGATGITLRVPVVTGTAALLGATV